MGNNGGYNPYRDKNGRWATPETSGKATDGGGGKKEVRAIWTDKPPPKTSRLGKPAGWAYSPSPLPPRYRAKAKAPAKAPPSPKQRAPQVPKKYGNYIEMAKKHDELGRQLDAAKWDLERSRSRSRYRSAEEQAAARKKAEADIQAIEKVYYEVKRDRNTYLNEMAKYRSQDDYRYD